MDDFDEPKRKNPVEATGEGFFKFFVEPVMWMFAIGAIGYGLVNGLDFMNRNVGFKCAHSPWAYGCAEAEDARNAENIQRMREALRRLDGQN